MVDIAEERSALGILAGVWCMLNNIVDKGTDHLLILRPGQWFVRDR